MAGVTPITQEGFALQDFSRVLNKTLSVDDHNEVLDRVLHPGGIHIVFPPTVQNHVGWQI